MLKKLHILICAYASEKMREREVYHYNQIMISDTQYRKTFLPLRASLGRTWLIMKWKGVRECVTFITSD